MREAALALLGMLPAGTLQQHLDDVLECLSDAQAEVRQAAVSAVGVLRGVEGVSALAWRSLAPLLSSTRADVSAAALQAMLALGVRSFGTPALEAIRAKADVADLQVKLLANAATLSLTMWMPLPPTRPRCAP